MKDSDGRVVLVCHQQTEQQGCVRVCVCGEARLSREGEIVRGCMYVGEGGKEEDTLQARHSEAVV